MRKISVGRKGAIQSILPEKLPSELAFASHQEIGDSAFNAASNRYLLNVAKEGENLYCNFAATYKLAMSVSGVFVVFLKVSFRVDHIVLALMCFI